MKFQSCDENLMDDLSKSVERVLGTPTYLSSGATHDSAAMSDICPIAMLFVRCLNGVSHNPKELASEEDMQLTVKVLSDFLLSLNKKKILKV
jgi:allantoate deiminase